MPKKNTNLQKQNGASSSDNVGSTDVAQPKTSKTEPSKPKATAKRKSTVSRKKPSSKSAPKSESPREPSVDDIRHRAYFIAERRAQLSLPADATADWLEAKRQLFVEAGLPVS